MDRTVHRWQCTASTGGCTSALVAEGRFDDGSDEERHFLALNGWWLDHGKWVCGDHERPTAPRYDPDIQRWDDLFADAGRPVTERFVVLRAYLGAPEGWMPEYWEGRWIDLDEVPSMRLGSGPGQAIAVATGRYEYREDGARAEVYEVRPEEPADG